MSCPIERKSIINLSIVTRQPPAQDRLITMLPFDSVSNSDPKILFFPIQTLKILVYFDAGEKENIVFERDHFVSVLQKIFYCAEMEIYNREQNE